MSLSVEERLRRYADDLDLAAATHPTTLEPSESTIVPLNIGRATSTRPQARRVLVATAALVLIVGAVTVLVRRDSHEGTASYPALGSHWVVPGPIDGYRLWYAQSLNEGLGYPERYRVLVARPSGDGGYADPVTITIGEHWRLWVTQERVAKYKAESVEVGSTTGEFVEDSINRTLVLQYALGNGDAVVLGVRNPSPQSRQRLLDLAAVVVPTQDGGLTSPTDLPDGSQVLAAMSMHHFFGTAPLLSFIDDDTRQSNINIESQAATPTLDYELFNMQDILEPIEVRGVSGWYSVAYDAPADQGGTVFWREPSGEVITVSGYSGADPNGSPSPKDDLLKIANNLRSVSESEWQDYAATAEATGAGVGEMAGPHQVAFPTTPNGYQLELAELRPVGNQYGLARYVPIDPSNGLPAIEIRLHNLSPEAWDQLLANELAGRDQLIANGRMLIDGGTGPGEGESTNQRSAVFEWTTNVIVEIVVSMPDGSPPTTTFADLVELANQVNRVSFFVGFDGEESPSSSDAGWQRAG